MIEKVGYFTLLGKLRLINVTKVLLLHLELHLKDLVKDPSSCVDLVRDVRVGVEAKHLGNVLRICVRAFKSHFLLLEQIPGEAARR